tara:strand:- start:13343 stop:13963 length:621 start_codon:yes stop_codon:yes gene_type:complete
MEMITIFGSARTRASVVLWLVEELGLDYRHENYDAVSDPTRTEEFRRLNPAGKLPVLMDGDFVLTETLAICFYLAKKYGHKYGNGRLLGEGLEEEARVMKWASFAMTELDAYAFQLLLAIKFKQQDPHSEICRDFLGMIDRSLKLLEGDLKGRDWLVGSEFSLADMLVCHGVNFAAMMGTDLSAFPVVKNWRKQCLSRPAFQKIRT